MPLTIASAPQLVIENVTPKLDGGRYPIKRVIGNNVAVSLMEACALMGTNFAIAAPKGYQMPEALVDAARQVAKKSGSEILISEDPAEAANDADALYSDVWLSMGDSEDQKAARQQALGPYQIQ